MLAGETRNVFAAVRNLGSATWPGGSAVPPEIRMAYHWRDGEGGALVQDGHRTPFPVAVAPGEECIVPVGVTAPETDGRYELSLDVVHEHVRWFECETRVVMEVTGVAAAPLEAPMTLRPSQRGPNLMAGDDVVIGEGVADRGQRRALRRHGARAGRRDRPRRGDRPAAPARPPHGVGGRRPARRRDRRRRRGRLRRRRLRGRAHRARRGGRRRRADPRAAPWSGPRAWSATPPASGAAP